MSPAQLDPEELRRLLEDATEPIRPGPEAYGRIRDGIARRRPWAMRMGIAGGLAVAAVAGVVYAAVPHSSGGTINANPVSGTGSVASGVSSTGVGAGPSRPAGAPPSVGSPSVGSSTGVRSTAPGSSAPSSAAPTPSTSSSAPAGTASGGPTVSTSPTPPAASTGTADLDGDGKSDAVTYDGATVSVVLSKGGTTVTVALPGTATAPTLTAVDLDGTGADELLVQTAPGPAAATYRVVALVGGKLTVVPQVLTAGLSPGSGAGFACVDQTLVAQTGTSTDGVTYTGTKTVYSYAAGVLTAVGTPGPVTVSLAAGGAGPFTAGCGVPPTS